ncbi:STAS domain-containing protein [Streptomyces sp900105245]|uniref:STAS domain-containing protein n=1 Tax=Streptomyces sp. 900105245 TaxID=3154379 RepID=UPI00332B3528
MLKPLDIHIRRPAPDHCVVTVAGELDVVTAAQLRHALQQAVATYPRTVVDLARVPFCDCTGLGALMAANRRAKERGAVLHLRCVPHAVACLLRLTHTSHAFVID